MALTVNRQVIRDRSGRIKFWKSDDQSREHYHVGIWIEGTDAELDSIQRVEYLLHPSFKNNLRKSENRDNKFSISIWTWGYFLIVVTILFKDGRTDSIRYSLSYDLPDDNGTNYVRVS